MYVSLKKLIQSTPEYGYVSCKSRTISDVLAVKGILISWTTWYSEWSFSAILYSTLWHVCALASIFFTWKKNNFHMICVMEKLLAVYDASWHLVVWVFAVILNSTLSHKCTFPAIFSREKKNHFHIICVMEKVPGRLWWRR
jgi:hypothetical protein